MKFFHEHIIFFYAVPFVIGSIFYLIFRSTANVVLLNIAVPFFCLGLIMWCYASWYKVVQIYRDFIYETPEQRQINKYRMATEIGFEMEYKEEKKYKKSIYKKSQIMYICMGLVSSFLIIYVLVRIVV